ncbi:hypothetical protein KKA24_00475 [Patescibacteria group bacterium]|nr:hypothetical protein [Patescibacteria group bacterium]
MELGLSSLYILKTGEKIMTTETLLLIISNGVLVFFGLVFLFFAWMLKICDKITDRKDYWITMLIAFSGVFFFIYGICSLPVLEKTKTGIVVTIIFFFILILILSCLVKGILSIINILRRKSKNISH